MGRFAAMRLAPHSLDVRGTMETSLSSELLSLVALLIALSSTVINYLVLKLQRDPEVVIYALHDERRPSIINLIIENSGPGVAQDVSFKSNRAIPTRAFGFENAEIPSDMTDGPLIQGIPSFASHERRIITWGQYGGLKKGLGDDVLDITATYYSRPPLSLTRQKHRTTSRIDLRSFEGTDASDHNWDKKAAENLGKIAQALSNVTNISNRSLKISVLEDEKDDKTH